MNVLLTGSTGCIARHFVHSMLKSNKNLTFTLLTTHPKTAAHIYSKFKKSITILSYIDEHTPKPDIILNLAGAPIISGPISLRLYGEIESSRLEYTKNLCGQLKKYNLFPHIFISASASGIYRASPESHSENSPQLGGDYIANLAMNWENAVWEGCKTAPTRTVLLRLGNVIAPDSNFFTQMAKIFKRGLGFTIKGEPIEMPWIDINDVLGAIAHIIRTPEIKGPVNLTSPEGCAFNDFAKNLAKALGKKTPLKLSPRIFTLTQGKLAPAITKSLQVIPEVLIKTGYMFCCPDIETALKEALHATKHKPSKS